MEQEIVNCILHKSFFELSFQEKEELAEWCASEEEFDQLKNVFLEVERRKEQPREFVRRETKKSLDELFTRKHLKSPAFWNLSVLTLLYPKDKSFFRRPIVQLAAVAILLFLAYPFFNSNPLEKKVQFAKNEVATKVSTQPMQKEKAAAVIDPIIEDKQNSSPVLTVSSSLENRSFMVEEVEPSPFERTESLADKAGAFDHPDGVYEEPAIITHSSLNASKMPEILDLLTAVF
jgi:hypothetical protein